MQLKWLPVLPSSFTRAKPREKRKSTAAASASPASPTPHLPFQAGFVHICASSLARKPPSSAEASRGCRGMLPLAQPGGMQADGTQGKLRGDTAEVTHRVTRFDSPSPGGHHLVPATVAPSSARDALIMNIQNAKTPPCFRSPHQKSPPSPHLRAQDAKASSSCKPPGQCLRWDAAQEARVFPLPRQRQTGGCRALRGLALCFLLLRRITEAGQQERFRGAAELRSVPRVLRNAATTSTGTAQRHPGGCAQDHIVANPDPPALLR